jgi:hypothetical protein
MLIPLLVIGVVAAIALVAYELLSVRMRWIARGRRGEGIEAFERFFLSRGYPTPLIRATYAELQRRAGVAGFPVRPHDSLQNIYGVDEAGLADLLCVIASVAQCADIPEFGATTLGPVTSVEDVVRVLTPLYRAATDNAADARRAFRSG